MGTITGHIQPSVEILDSDDTATKTPVKDIPTLTWFTGELQSHQGVFLKGGWNTLYFFGPTGLATYWDAIAGNMNVIKNYKPLTALTLKAVR